VADDPERQPQARRQAKHAEHGHLAALLGPDFAGTTNRRPSTVIDSTSIIAAVASDTGCPRNQQIQ
jgi:hypothetical protein